MTGSFLKKIDSLKKVKVGKRVICLFTVNSNPDFKKFDTFFTLF